jgi:hypothetical protein
MSHFLLRVGDLFNFHPLTHAYDVCESFEAEDPPALVPERPDARVSDELARFSLVSDGKAEDPRVELGIFALLSDAGATRHRPGKDWTADRWM